MMDDTNSRRIAKNTMFLYLRMLIVMLINIFSVRFVLKGLGVVDYGIYNVVAGVVTMFSGLSSIISSATLRFHSYYIGEGHDEKVSDVFTVSINIFLFISLIILVAGEIIGVWFINAKADIPMPRIVAANWVFQFSIISFILSLISAPFSAILFAYERMNVFSIISVCECVLKFILAYILVYSSSDHLILYGTGLCIIALAVFLTYFTIVKSERRVIYKKHVENSLYKKMLSFSGWTLFSSSAGVGISQLVTMITNVFFGPVVNAARAVAFQINGSLSSFTSNIILAIKPPMIKYYAEGDFNKVSSHFIFCNKAVYYSLLLILLPLFFEMEIILDLWLDVQDAQTSLFCRLILVYALVLSLNNPISIVVHAVGNIKAYSTVVEIPTLLCFPVVWFLYSLGFPPQVAFFVMIGAIVVSHIIRLVCFKKLFTLFSYKEYFGGFVFPAGIILFLTSLILLIVHNVMEYGFARLFITFLVNAFLIVCLGLFLGFNKSERLTIFKLLRFRKN